MLFFNIIKYLFSLIQKAKFCAKRSIQKNGFECPISTVIINYSTGTRTVLHYRGNMPEIKTSEFQTTFGDVISDFSWFHFEGIDYFLITFKFQ